jgi:hypothetical protein
VAIAGVVYAECAKQMTVRSRKVKKQPIETRYFYNNARALALLAGKLEAEDPIVVLSRLNDKIDAGEIDIDRITDLPSLIVSQCYEYIDRYLHPPQ